MTVGELVINLLQTDLTKEIYFLPVDEDKKVYDIEHILEVRNAVTILLEEN